MLQLPALGRLGRRIQVQGQLGCRTKTCLKHKIVFFKFNKIFSQLAVGDSDDKCDSLCIALGMAQAFATSTSVYMCVSHGACEVVYYVRTVVWNPNSILTHLIGAQASMILNKLVFPASASHYPYQLLLANTSIGPTSWL